MAEIPVLIGNEYYRNSTETHYEGYVETRAEVANASTDWAVGSTILCGQDLSVWALLTSSGTKTWTEIGGN